MTRLRSSAVTPDLVKRLIKRKFPELKEEFLLWAVAILPSITAEECLEKYERGRKEHGDDISRVDALASLREELVDGINYVAIDSFQ